jgi:hypothetical protein
LPLNRNQAVQLIKVPARELPKVWGQVVKQAAKSRERKCSHGNAAGERRKSGEKFLSGHDDHLEKTADVVAKDFGVSEATVRRDAKFAEKEF